MRLAIIALCIAASIACGFIAYAAYVYAQPCGGTLGGYGGVGAPPACH